MIIPYEKHLKYGDVLKHLNHELCYILTEQQHKGSTKEKTILKHLNVVRNLMDDLLYRDYNKLKDYTLSKVYYGDIQ